jgi:hypothetical protein
MAATKTKKGIKEMLLADIAERKELLKKDKIITERSVKYNVEKQKEWEKWKTAHGSQCKECGVPLGIICFQYSPESERKLWVRCSNCGIILQS